MKTVFLCFFEGKTGGMQILDPECIESFTRWPKTEGHTLGFPPRMGSQVWRGHNSVMMFPIEDQRLDDLLARIATFNEATDYEGISAYAVDITGMGINARPSYPAAPSDVGKTGG